MVSSVSTWETNGFLGGEDIVSSKYIGGITNKIHQFEKSMPGYKFPPQMHLLHLTVFKTQVP